MFVFSSDCIHILFQDLHDLQVVGIGYLDFSELRPPYPTPHQTADLGFLGFYSLRFIHFTITLGSPQQETYRRNDSILRRWAHILLERCEAFFGVDHCKRALAQPQKVYTMFSGIECAREAWRMIEVAAEKRWQIKCGLKFVFAVPFCNTSIFLNNTMFFLGYTTFITF